MLRSKSVVERALELAASGAFRIPSQVKRALIDEGYTQSDVFILEGRATAAQLRARCAESHVPAPGRLLSSRAQGGPPA